MGRFTAEDILQGRNTAPKTLNRYGYCSADRVVDDFAYQMDCIENDIKDAVNEGYQMVKDGVQTGLDFLGDIAHKAADFAMDTVNDGVH